MHACGHACTYVCMYICAYVGTFVHAYVCMYVCIHDCTYTSVTERQLCFIQQQMATPSVRPVIFQLKNKKITSEWPLPPPSSRRNLPSSSTSIYLFLWGRKPTPTPSLLASQSSVLFYINLSISLWLKTQLSHVGPKRLARTGVSPSHSLCLSISLLPSPRVAILCLLLHQSIDFFPLAISFSLSLLSLLRSFVLLFSFALSFFPSLTCVPSLPFLGGGVENQT